MSKVYWDTMLFIYLLEDTDNKAERVASIYESMSRRGDTLCASFFTLAELLVGPRKQGDGGLEQRIVGFFESGAVKILPFDQSAAKRFADIRAGGKISCADAIHLSCAAASGVDLFLTHDSTVQKAMINGIHFIDGLQTTVLGARLD
ncbi:MAG: PIN domain-containing protein [Fimbriimonas sp.]|nr:PIN domain-containing protein [Fimbriimonas sp.]